jgi:hypothetical protein
MNIEAYCEKHNWEIIAWRGQHLVVRCKDSHRYATACFVGGQTEFHGSWKNMEEAISWFEEVCVE